MDNPETQATLGTHMTHDENKQNNNTENQFKVNRTCVEL